MLLYSAEKIKISVIFLSLHNHVLLCTNLSQWTFEKNTDFCGWNVKKFNRCENLHKVIYTDYHFSFFFLQTWTDKKCKGKTNRSQCKNKKSLTQCQLKEIHQPCLWRGFIPFHLMVRHWRNNFTVVGMYWKSDDWFRSNAILPATLAETQIYSAWQWVTGLNISSVGFHTVLPLSFCWPII